jgi:hypothetical protein
MTRHPLLFDTDSLILARIEFVQEARALSRGGERDQKRQIARSLKRLIESQRPARLLDSVTESVALPPKGKGNCNAWDPKTDNETLLDARAALRQMPVADGTRERYSWNGHSRRTYL